MSEGNHSAVEITIKSRRSRLPLIFGSIAVSALIAGVLFQFLRSEPTAAQTESAEAESGDAAGSVHLQKRPGELKTLANVNGQLITRDMVALECLNRYGTDVLESIVDRMIVQQACEEQGIQITTAEVDAEVIKIAKRFNLTPDNWYQMLQAERKISPDQYRRNIIWPMLALRKLAGENVEISDEDLQRAYVRDYGEKVQARMIMLDNKRRADEVWEKANANPESFGELARKFSIEANSRSLDGAIPPIKQYGSAEESALEEAAFKLKEKGEISGIVQIGVGQQYVILQYEGRTKRMVEFDEVKESLVEQLKEEKTQLAVANIFTKLKENAKVQNFVTNTVSGGGVKKASATTTGAHEQVTPAAATRTRPATSQQQPQQRPRQAQRQPKSEN